MAEPHIQERDEQSYVSIRTRATLREWSRVNARVAQVFGWLDERGMDRAGPPFYRYWIIGDDDNEFDLEVGVPVNTVPETEEPFRVGTIPEGSYVRMVHRGHPDRLERAHEEIRRWADHEGVRLKREIDGGEEVWSGLFEFYLSDPAVEPDLNRWETELLYQVS